MKTINFINQTNLIILIVLVFFPMSMVQAKGRANTKNVVKNGDFVSGKRGWLLCSMASVSRIMGSNSLIIKDTKKDAGSDTTSASISVIPNQVYTVSAKFRYTGEQSELVYLSTDETAPREWVLLETKNLAQDQWHDISATIKIPDGVTSVKLWLHTSSNAIGNYIFDDIEFRQGAIPTFLKKSIKGHPRIYLTKNKIKQIKRNIANDPKTKEAALIVVANAEKILGDKPIAYKKDGNRMLGPAREALSRIKTLGMAYHLTGRSRYAQAAIKIMLTAAKIPHWNPGHYLDTATLSLALGLGYDWFYANLSSTQRKLIVDAIVEKGIQPSWTKGMWWVTSKSNWNQVCNGGLGIASLAIWEQAPDIATKTIKRSLSGIPHTMKTYAPEGIYLEGPSYWNYGTTYTVKFITALENVMKTDHGLSKSPGFLQSLDTINYITGPLNLYLNFSDGFRFRSSSVVSYWFANRLRNPNLLYIENGLMRRAISRKRDTDFVMYLIWGSSEQEAQPPEQLHWHGMGAQPIATFRSSWGRDSTFAAMKGGISSTGHGHMDVGGFVIDSDGVRWASDSPSQNYNLEERARAKAKAKGEKFAPAFYRDRWSHNILVVDGKKPVVGSQSPMLEFSDAKQNPFVIFDLAPAYKDQLTQPKRGMRILRDKCIIVQDEFTTLDKAETTIRWSMLTLGSPNITSKSVSDDGKRLTLQNRSKTKSMRMEILSPANAKFDVVVVNDQPYIRDFDKISKDARQVLINLKLPANKKETLTILFTPGSVTDTQPSPAIVPLSDWETIK